MAYNPSFNNPLHGPNWSYVPTNYPAVHVGSMPGELTSKRILAQEAEIDRLVKSGYTLNGWTANVQRLTKP